jgi:H+-transporting ATPase
VWGYALVWFLLNDRIKLLTYWVLDRSKSQAKSNVKAVDGKIDVNAAAQAPPARGPESQAESHTDRDVAPETQADPRPRPEAKSAAEQPQATATSEEKNPLAPDSKATGAHPTNTEPAPGTSAAKPAETIPSPSTGSQTDKDSAAQEAKTVAGNPAKTPTNLTPKLVERVHALYEELGRQDVLAVQELEQAEKTSKEAAP